MKFNFIHLKGDLLGGLTAGIVALPLALPFGVSSGLGPSAGLYGAIFISFFAALFGGTPTQISGPTAPMTAVSMVVIATIIGVHDGDLGKAIPYILIVFLLSGLFQILLGIVKLGTYIKYIPYPVVSGFMTAIGVIILVTQLQPMVGYEVVKDSDYVQQFIPKAEALLLEKILEEESEEGILVLEDFHETISRAEQIGPDQIRQEAQFLAEKNSSGVLGTFRMLSRLHHHINWIEVLLTLLTVVIIYGFKRISRSVPSTLVALVGVTLGAVLFNIDYRPIQQIPEGFPKLQTAVFTTFNFAEILPYLATALTLALLGAIDSLLTSVVADNLTKTKHKPNQELIGQGIGNSISSLFGGLPGAGATIRTVVNIHSGGKTKLSGMVAALVLLMILLVMGPIASQIPAAVLAGILITVGIGVMDYRGLRALPKIPRSEVIVMVVVLILAVVWNLVYAVGIGLIIAALFFMKKMGDVTHEMSEVGPIQKEPSWRDEKSLTSEFLEKVFIKHIEGPLFFGFTSDFQTLSKQLPDSAKVVLIRMSRVPMIDQSGLFALEDVLIDLTQKGITPFLVGIREQPEYLMQTIGIINKLIPKEHIFTDFDSCRGWLVKNLHRFQ